MALFVLSLCPFDISVGVGAFVIGLSQISSFFSFVALLNRFEKETVPNEHLVSADPFYRSKNRTFMKSFFS